MYSDEMESGENDVKFVPKSTKELSPPECKIGKSHRQCSPCHPNPADVSDEYQNQENTLRDTTFRSPKKLIRDTGLPHTRPVLSDVWDNTQLQRIFNLKRDKQLVEKDETILRLKKRIDGLEQHLSEKNFEDEVLFTYVKGIQDERENLQAEKDALRQQLLLQNKEMESISHKLDQKTKSNEMLSTQIAMMKQMCRVKEEFKHFRDRIVVREKVIADLNAKVNSTEKEKENLLNQNNSLQEQVTRIIDERERARQQADHHEQENTRLEKSVKKSLKRCALLEGKLKKNKVEMQGKRVSYSRRLKAKSSHHWKQNRTLLEQIKSKARNEQSLKAQNCELQNRVDQVEQEIKEMKALNKDVHDIMNGSPLPEVDSDSIVTMLDGHSQPLSLLIPHPHVFTGTKCGKGEQRGTSSKPEDTARTPIYSTGRESLSPARFSPRLRKRTKPLETRRTVKEEYKRWTDQDRIRLLTALIEIRKEFEEQNQKPTEAIVLRQVCERCGFPEVKTRDHLNNLLRTYSPNGSARKTNLSSIKADPVRYNKHLEFILETLERKLGNTTTVL